MRRLMSREGLLLDLKNLRGFRWCALLRDATKEEGASPSPPQPLQAAVLVVVLPTSSAASSASSLFPTHFFPPLVADRRAIEWRTLALMVRFTSASGRRGGVLVWWGCNSEVKWETSSRFSFPARALLLQMAWCNDKEGHVESGALAARREGCSNDQSSCERDVAFSAQGKESVALVDEAPHVQTLFT